MCDSRGFTHRVVLSIFLTWKLGLTALECWDQSVEDEPASGCSLMLEPIPSPLPTSPAASQEGAIALCASLWGEEVLLFGSKVGAGLFLVVESNAAALRGVSQPLSCCGLGCVPVGSHGYALDRLAKAGLGLCYFSYFSSDTDTFIVENHL